MTELSLFQKIIRVLTFPLRKNPDFVIIGAQKSGTTSLFDYLSLHPQIVPPAKKEINYYSHAYRKPYFWYKAHFPLNTDKRFLTGEASPYYLDHPCTPERIFKRSPGIKVVAILRNPIDRAYSHYQHCVRRNMESLSFAEAILSENRRIEGEEEKLLLENNYNSFSYTYFGYANRGLYGKHLKKWQKFFKKENIHIIIFEDLIKNPPEVLSSLCDFLGIENIDSLNKKFPLHNIGGYSREIPKDISSYLEEKFREDNIELSNMLNRNLPWTK